MLKFIRLREEHLEQVLRWRTHPDITRYMFTDIEYDLQRQFEWYKRVSQIDNDRYWVISLNEKLIGLVSIHDFNQLNQRCSWAFYIGELEYRMIGAMIPVYLYNYLFGHLHLKKVVGEVMAGNDSVRNMHLKHGCREVGVYREHVYKYGQFHDVYIYEMLDLDWKTVGEQYEHYVTPFE